MARQIWGCGRCPALHLGPEALRGTPCPACGAGRLQADPLPGEHVRADPEWIVPFQVIADDAMQELSEHIAGTPYPCPQLDPALLRQRLIPVFWPRWLVDAQVDGIWEAEAGFPIEVESSASTYEGGDWQTRTFTEIRLDWQIRLGRVRRRYDDLDVPALDEHEQLDAWVGPLALDPRGAQPATDEAIGAVVVRLPDRRPGEQWPAAVQLLRASVAEDCRQATGADEIRDLVLELDAQQLAWTLGLLPGWVTWYEDDEGVCRLLYVNGHTWAVGGPRLSSVAAGRRAAIRWFVGAALCGAAGLTLGLIGIVLWPVIALAAVALLAALVCGCVGLVPLLQPRAHNARELAHR